MFVRTWPLSSHKLQTANQDATFEQQPVHKRFTAEGRWPGVWGGAGRVVVGSLEGGERAPEGEMGGKGEREVSRGNSESNKVLQ